MLPLDARLLVLCSLQRSASALVPNSSPGFELSHPNVVEQAMHPKPTPLVLVHQLICRP